MLLHFYYQMSNHWINTTDFKPCFTVISIRIIAKYLMYPLVSKQNSAQVGIYDVFLKRDSKLHIKRPIKRFYSGFEIHIHSSVFALVFSWIFWDVLCSISHRTFVLSQAKLLFMPVQGSFLSGVAALLVFVLLLMLQSGVIAGRNMYL